jgi:uncharacterized protein YjbI with pentapeptide repeats
MRFSLPVSLISIVLALAVPAQAAFAQDNLARQLIDACVGCTLPKDLHGRDLHGLHFVGTNLRDVNFTHANLSGAEFTGANLDGTRFDDADLRNARFVGVRLRNVSFARANTDGVSSVGASVSQSDVGGDAGRMILRDCTGCSFSELDLHGVDLRGIKIVGASIRDANLAGARLNDAQLIGVSARGADLSRVDLSGANLVGASLRGAHLGGATIGNAVLCTPSRNDREGYGDGRTACADLRGVDLHGLDFRAARYCVNDERPQRECRVVTRRELTDYAHADLTGAQAPA